MQIQLTPTYVLKDGNPIALCSAEGHAYAPNDILRAYPSHDLAPAARFVKRVARMDRLTEEEIKLVAAYLRQWPEGPQL